MMARWHLERFIQVKSKSGTSQDSLQSTPLQTRLPQKLDSSHGEPSEVFSLSVHATPFPLTVCVGSEARRTLKLLMFSCLSVQFNAREHLTPCPGERAQTQASPVLPHFFPHWPGGTGVRDAPWLSTRPLVAQYALGLQHLIITSRVILESNTCISFQPHSMSWSLTASLGHDLYKTMTP